MGVSHCTMMSKMAYQYRWLKFWLSAASVYRYAIMMASYRLEKKLIRSMRRL